jgi:carboxymethylenebutenolidase
LGAARGAVVVLQEIFGVNAQTRRVAENFAREGFLAIAPAMFDRGQPDAVLEYSEVERGLALANGIGEDALVADLQAAVDAVRSAGPVTVVGFCWGGALAYLAAARCTNVARAICFYGTRIVRMCDTCKPAVPVQYHFGALDKSLPHEAIEKIRAADTGGEFFVYPQADHAFTNEDRPNYQPEAAQLAHGRALAFIATR